MGLRFQKSINLGAFRVNVSKSGVGFSVGRRGARAGISATGRKYTTVSLPGTGISYDQTIGGKGKKGCLVAIVAMLGMLAMLALTAWGGAALALAVVGSC